MFRIVILDGYVANPGDLSWDEFRELGELTVYDRTAPEDILQRAADADAVIVNKVVITDEIMQKLPRLKYIGILATGYNNIDIDAASRCNIKVCNVPNYSTESVAQLVFSHLLNVVMSAEKHSVSVHNGDWCACNDFSYRVSPIFEVAGMTMGIYGLGNIGKKVAQIANGFGMKVIALTSKSQSELPEYITKVAKEDLFSQCDVLSLNAPLTAENTGFVNEHTLSLMKNSAIIINTARGGLVDEKALADALNNSRIFAACIDVLSKEPADESNPLLSAKNCCITPHIAWQSDVARKKLLAVCADNIRKFIAGTPVNVVNK